MEYTPNLNLAKPGTDDDVDVSVLNNNSDIIDSTIANCKTNYSTTEHEVGTWIDGSKLYEITIQETLAEAGEHNIDISNLNVNKLINSEIYAIDENGINFSESSVFVGGQVVFSLGAFYGEGHLYVELYDAELVGYPLTAYVTIRYTKVSE